MPALDENRYTGVERLLDSAYLLKLPNLHTPHPRLLVLFSGPPSSGKSTAAAQIADALEGLRIENDAVRIHLRQHIPDITFDERAAATRRYTLHMRDYLAAQSPNGLWIIDSSADRRYDEYASFAEDKHFALFLIAMLIPERTHRLWITQGGHRPILAVNDYLRMLPQRRREQALLLERRRPDSTLAPGYDIAALISRLKLRLDSL